MDRLLLPKTQYWWEYRPQKKEKNNPKSSALEMDQSWSQKFSSEKRLKTAFKQLKLARLI